MTCYLRERHSNTNGDQPSERGSKMSETNETTDRADLSYLSGIEPKVTTFRAARKGRQPGANPVADHVKRSASTGETLSLPVPAKHARQTERMIRRAATRYDLSVSVQVLIQDPETADVDSVIALKELGTLPGDTDVWVSFKAAEKASEESDAETGTETPKTDLEPVADPFAGQPTGDTEPEAGSEDEPEAETKGHRSGRRAKANA